MIIQPKIRGFICTTAHPDGCFQEVLKQITVVKSQGKIKGLKTALIIGCSTGYGLASRISATFGAGASTIGVCYERSADEKRTASAGWYNTAAFEKLAHQENYYAKTINGDAFSNEIKQKTAELIKNDLNKIDLIIYSLAAPRRIDPDTGEVFNSILKPIGQAFTGKTVDPFKEEVKEVFLEPASNNEIEQTIKVMGGEDWERWINFLKEKDLLAENVITVAYSYIGPELTHAIYKEGTIGRAKDHLQYTANKLNETLKSIGGSALISVNKALVTQASSAIPVVPLYISILFKIMKEKGIHEGCIEQTERLFRRYLYSDNSIPVDEQGLIRIDDLEMQKSVQNEVMKIWTKVTSQNLKELTDIDGYVIDFKRLFGFGNTEIDYQAEVNPDICIPSIKEELIIAG